VRHLALRRTPVLSTAVLLVAAIATLDAGAQTPAVAGKWRLRLATGNNPHFGILEIVPRADTLDFYVDGGPVNLLERSGDALRFDLDWTDGGDRLRIWELSGRFTDDRLDGDVSENGEHVGTWSAVRWQPHPDTGAAPRPVDLSGVWVSLSRGTHKDAFDMTPTAQAINDAYDPTLDDPHLRCIAGGVIRMEDGPFPLEIIVRDDQIVVLYEYFHQVRRIWMDGRDFPEDIEFAYSQMGYSIGHWEGASLVVETRGMRPTVWDAAGQPVSANAVITERKYLDEEGRLHADYTLVDPEHFARPVYRHAYWERRASVGVGGSACDPHSFYRSLDLEGRLEEYWGRSANRL